MDEDRCKIFIFIKFIRHQYCNFCEPKGPQKGQLNGRDASPGGLSDWSTSQVKAETKGSIAMGIFDILSKDREA